jgi:hypothetical protein
MSARLVKLSLRGAEFQLKKLNQLEYYAPNNNSNLISVNYFM